MCVKGVILNRDINENLNSREQMLNWKKFFIFMVCEGGDVEEIGAFYKLNGTEHLMQIG